MMKMEKKLQKIYLTYYNLLTLQDLCQDHYKILSIIFLKEFEKLNVNTDTMIKNDCFLEYTKFKDDLIEYQGLCYNRIYQEKFKQKLRERFF